MRILLVELFFALGIVFAVIGNVGVLLFPDVFTRLQASSTCSTTSVFSIFIACMFHEGLSPMTGRILVIALFFFVSSPISAHIIARFAWESGIVPWRKYRLPEPPDVSEPGGEEEPE